MNITLWTKPKAFFLFILGAVILIAPDIFFGLFGLELSTAGEVVARMYSAVFFPTGLALWRITSNTDFSAKDALFATLGDSIAFVVLLMAQLSGLMNSLGWILVATCLFSALGFVWCYLQIAKNPTSNAAELKPSY